MFTEKKPGALRVALVGCSASKLKKSAPARELYTSAFFRAAYDYAEKTCDAVLIVSCGDFGATRPTAPRQCSPSGSRRSPRPTRGGP